MEYDYNTYEVECVCPDGSVGSELFRAYKDAEGYYLEMIEENYAIKINFITWLDSCDKTINSTWEKNK